MYMATLPCLAKDWRRHSLRQKTYLLINAYQRADEATKAQLLTLIGNNSMEAEAKIKAVTDIYNALDIPALTRAAINRFYDEAHNELRKLSLPESQWSVLWNYATSLLGRNK